MCNRFLQENGVRLQFPAEYHRGHIIIHKLIVYLQLALIGHAFHIRILYKAYNLQPGRVKILKIACQLQRRTVDIGLRNTDILHVDLGRKVLQLHFID